MRYATYPPVSADVVLSVIPGYFYPCPDVSTVDRFLANLQANFLRPDSNATEEYKAKVRMDIDQLLLRRVYLETVGG
jgi:hypothetical protein